MEAPPSDADRPTPPWRRVDPATWAVLAALVGLAAAWLVWARVNGAPGGGFGWGPLDSILAASMDRQIAQPAPPFTLADPSGTTVSLEELRGQVVLVNFWATWCLPCRAEMPELDEFAREYQGAGFRVLAVNVLEDADAVRRFGEELQLELPLLVDPHGEVYRAYGVQGLPTSFLVDPEGVIRHVQLGVVSRRFLQARVPALLGTRS